MGLSSFLGFVGRSGKTRKTENTNIMYGNRIVQTIDSLTPCCPPNHKAGDKHDSEVKRM